MKKLLLLLFILRMSLVLGQDTTYYGDRVSPEDRFRVLNLFINIIYDICPTCDPFYQKLTPNWLPDTENSINKNLPSYLDDYMDSDFNPSNIHGSLRTNLTDAIFLDYLLFKNKEKLCRGQIRGRLFLIIFN